MHPEKHASPAAITKTRPSGTRGPQWRAILEARWQARLEDLIALSLAYHEAAAAAPGRSGAGAGQPEAQRLLRRTVAARRKLADAEEALSRLAAGNFGSCEQCRSAIPAGLLAAVPETRYCRDCAAHPVPARQPAVARSVLR